jgi:hypothetical protein
MGILPPYHSSIRHHHQGRRGILGSDHNVGPETPYLLANATSHCSTFERDAIQQIAMVGQEPPSEELLVEPLGEQVVVEKDDPEITSGCKRVI